MSTRTTNTTKEVVVSFTRFDIEGELARQGFAVSQEDVTSVMRALRVSLPLIISIREILSDVITVWASDKDKTETPHGIVINHKN